MTSLQENLNRNQEKLSSHSILFIIQDFINIIRIFEKEKLPLELITI